MRSIRTRNTDPIIYRSINTHVYMYDTFLNIVFICTHKESFKTKQIQYRLTQTWHLFSITCKCSQILFESLVNDCALTHVVTRIWLASGGDWLLHESLYEPPYEFCRGSSSTSIDSWNTWFPLHYSFLVMDININKWLHNGKVAWVMNVGVITLHALTEIRRILQIGAWLLYIPSRITIPRGYR